MKHAIGFAIAAALGVGMVAGTGTVELRARTSLVSFTPVVYSSLIPQFARRGGAVDDASVHPSAPTSAYSMDVPLAYYNLSFTLSKRTGGITPPVQARIFTYMGLALYESVVDGMSRNRSIARSLHGIGPLPRNAGTKYWPLVASAAMAEVMRGLWGDATNVATQNIADIASLEEQIANSFDLQGSLARRSIDYGHSGRRRGVRDIAR